MPLPAATQDCETCAGGIEVSIHSPICPRLNYFYSSFEPFINRDGSGIIKLMLKGKQRGYKKHTDTVAEGDQLRVVISENPSTPLFKKASLLGVLLVVLLVLLAVFLLYRHQKQRAAELGTPIPTAVEYAKGQEQVLLKQKPENNAPLQAKLAYYDNLQNTEDTAGDYQGAITTFLTREKLSAQGLDYHSYYRLAQYYQLTGNKQAALGALDKASATIPSDNPSEGFYKANVEKNIEHFRQELSK